VSGRADDGGVVLGAIYMGTGADVATGHDLAGGDGADFEG